MPDGNSRNDPRLVRGAELGGSASDLQDIKARLTERIESLATTLLGQPTPVSRRRRDWHFPGHGGAYLVVRGRKRGAFFCHSNGQGGGALELIMFARSCSFAGALDWAKSWLGIRDGDPLPTPDVSFLAKRAEVKAKAESEAEKDERGRIAFARAKWLQSVSIVGTLAQRYLTETRGIRAPACGWPDAVRFHPQTGSLIVSATTADGTVQAIQRVFLTTDGKKAAATETRPSKQTGRPRRTRADRGPPGGGVPR